MITGQIGDEEVTMAAATVRALRDEIRVLYDGGKANANAMAEALDVSVADLARAFGIKPNTLSKNPTCADFQEPGHRLGRVIEDLYDLFGDDRQSLLVWIRRRLPDLSNHTPLGLMLDGNLDVIEDFVDDIKTGQPG